VRFTFVSCENHQVGAGNAYRRMIWEDERAAPADRVEFVMHLGDFFYELNWYPEDLPQGMYGRKVRDLVRYPDGERHGAFHVPTTLRDYRALYQAYLTDPDLQDARARWPFVYMADNHDFSWKGWQSQEDFGQGVVPAQTRKVAASRAWFEYQPSRAVHPGSGGLAAFDAPAVLDAPLTRFDNDGLGLEPGNLAAIECLRRYRSAAWGANVDLILTDNRTFRSQPLSDQLGTKPFIPADFPAVVSEDVTAILDAGRAFDGGRPPSTIRYGATDLPNPRKDASPQSMLGSVQKRWLLDQLRSSRAPWKLWGNSVAMLDWRTDFQNLPETVGLRWPTTGYALFGDDDWSGYRYERQEILEFVRRERITGVATLCGDRHAFLAGTLAPAAGAPADPVVAEFVTGSISAPGLFEALEHALPETHPLRPVFAHRNPATGLVEPAINLSITGGVGACFELARTNDPAAAAAKSNPDVAPGIAFADTGGHGYAVVTADARRLAVEFVCIPRPLEPAGTPDGGPVAYRITHTVHLWGPGEFARLERASRTGVLPLGAVNPSGRFGPAW
jgi:alkaline phosphatase D